MNDYFKTLFEAFVTPPKDTSPNRAFRRRLARHALGRVVSKPIRGKAGRRGAHDV